MEKKVSCLDSGNGDPIGTNIEYNAESNKGK
jgi:hypothetical protein